MLRTIDYDTHVAGNTIATLTDKERFESTFMQWNLLLNGKRWEND